MNYQERLNPWIVQQSSSNPEQRILARFRRRVDADAYLNTVRHRYPHDKLSVAFAVESKTDGDAVAG